MSKRKKPGQGDLTAKSITVQIGSEGENQLSRCQALLASREPSGRHPSAGLTIRLAIRRMLLSLLGERADWLNPHCPFSQQYLDLLRYEASQQEIPGLPSAARNAGAPPTRSPDGKRGGEEGGGE